MPDVVISRHGRYELVQGTGGSEIREDLSKRHRVGAIISTALLGVAALLHFEFANAMALPFAVVGTFVALQALRSRGKVLVLGDSELRYGEAGASHDRSGVWPRSRVARVRVEKVGSAPRPQERGRRFGPVYVVRVVASDGALHPARFAFRQQEQARQLAKVIADRLDVPLEEK